MNGTDEASIEAGFAKTININLIGTFACIAQSAAGMLNLDPLEDGERGVIINTASVAAEDGQIGQAASTPFPKRRGHPEEYADTILFLVQNVYIKGASLCLDGALGVAPR